ncbi:MAG: type 4a pilus biogenesis protein PilO [Desulfomonile tiedjei]|uniref:Type 4a pilus biogenesis protein PilO n=1 Tax=Desulfomonile tiedjei TaxID=2358 RepID=A0A9D6V9U9_9BACT|nr:type 4a pilus biogenesis protein PilO [Desulfomonile tiedjei]
MAIAVDEIFFKVTKLQRILIVAAVCILLMVGFYFLVIADIQDKITSLEKQIGQLRMDIENQERILAEGPKLKARIQELEQKLQTMVASLPEKQDIEQLLKRITDLLSESNLVATKFAPGQEQVNEELYYATIPIQLSVRGDYSKQGTFLTSLNDLPRIVNVPTIRLHKSGGLTSRESDLAKKLDVISLDGEISGVTYRRLSAEEQKAITQKKAAQPRKK